AQDWLAVTEGALQEAEQVLLRARELALRGANATLDDTSRQALADEAQVLFDHLLEISNASYKGRYLFGGTATTNPPFVADPADPDAIAYEGNTHGIERELGAGIHLTINVTGDLFKPMFSVLAALRDQLLAGDQAALGGATLAQLDERLDALIETRSTVGARMQRAELSAQRLEDLQLQVEKLNASLSQVDLAEVLMDLRSTEVTLRAALATGARLIQPTLADYLG
ncbi:MAG TPA: flagellar hook protein, partial [Bacillota bacterium]